MDSDEWTVQYCQGDADISGNLSAELDADEARVWTPTADLVAGVEAVHDGFGRQWRLIGGDGNWTRFEDERFGSPLEAAKRMTEAT